MLPRQEGMAHPDVYSMHLCGISFPSSSIARNQHDNEDEAEPAAAIVARPVERTAPNPLKPPSNAITKIMSTMVPSDILESPFPGSDAIANWLPTSNATKHLKP
jgi:hypothetical protein